jgi:hypothetical protein
MAKAKPTYEELKRTRDDVQREIDRASGVRDNALKKLRDEYKCDTLAKAKKLLAKYEAEEREGETKYAAAVDAFVSAWGDRLADAETRR